MKKSEIPTNSYMVAEVELVYKSKVKAVDRPLVRCSNDAYKILLNLEQE